MLLDLARVKVLLATLDLARRESTGPGLGHWCPGPNVGEDGQTFRVEPKPRARAAVGTRYPDGTVLELIGGAKAVRVPLGLHGRAHLAIDPETGSVCCAACAAKGVSHR